MDVKACLRELIDRLNEASKAYYDEDRELMSNLEYDRLYSQLEELEKTSGIIFSDSPTVNVGYEISDELPKVVHETPMLSLDKTKEPSALRAFVGSHPSLLSWKLDGLTIVLTYENGTLARAVTRGNGQVGELVTPNARTFKNIPLRIPYQGQLVLRGEAVIRYSDFERINREIEDVEAKYKNPRNLCSGSVRQLNPQITAERSVYFYAFALVSAGNVDFKNSRAEQFRWLKTQGFDVVDYRMVTEDTVEETIREFSNRITANDFPSDGLVALYDDIAYGDSLGNTAKFPRNAFAFKWEDELKETVLRQVEWRTSRTGLMNPIAVFDPVELEGTTVKRASLHNVSIVRQLKLGLGDRLTVYKANMIIPQIAENLTKSDSLRIPDHCQVCGGRADLRRDEEKGSEVLTLHCLNEECQARKIRSYALLVSRDALNIEGLSEATLEKFIGSGIIHEPADIFHLEQHRKEIEEMEGFGEKSYLKLRDNIRASSHTSLSRLLYGLGIPNVGHVTARLISLAFDENIERIKKSREEELADIPAVGPVIANAFSQWMRNEKNSQMLDKLLDCLTFVKEAPITGDSPVSGKIFVITGSLMYYKNRNELKADIEKMGGKVTGSVSSRTDYLINNDRTSTSGKNKTALMLGIPIISEDDLKNMMENKQENR